MKKFTAVFDTEFVFQTGRQTDDFLEKSMRILRTYETANKDFEQVRQPTTKAVIMERHPTRLWQVLNELSVWSIDIKPKVVITAIFTNLRNPPRRQMKQYDPDAVKYYNFAESYGIQQSVAGDQLDYRIVDFN